MNIIKKFLILLRLKYGRFKPSSDRGFFINGRLFPLFSYPRWDVFDQSTGEQINLVFFIDAHTGKYGAFSPGTNGQPYLNDERTEAVRYWSQGKLRVVFDEIPPFAPTKEMMIPLTH